MVTVDIDKNADRSDDIKCIAQRNHRFFLIRAVLYGFVQETNGLYPEKEKNMFLTNSHALSLIPQLCNTILSYPIPTVFVPRDCKKSMQKTTV
mmetsp:Transcript_8948/g.21825  ORF Transcript_8948/g.21825 Transcript_8948/m.21825 type:complete len:93 (-) Transcript_8948:572-850(-)